MSRYLQNNDEDEPAFVSSNAGWSDFMGWADQAENAPQLKQLMDEGTCDDTAACAEEIAAHMESNPPSEDNLSIAETLIEFLGDIPEGAEISIIN